MKRFALITALFVGLAMSAVVPLAALAATPPPDSPFAIGQAIAPDATPQPRNVGACLLAISENIRDCVLTVSQLSGHCPSEIVPMIRAGGDRLFASNAFLAACASAPAPRPPD